MSTADLLTLTGSVEIQASQPPDRPARVQIMAYSGGEMTVPGWGPLVIDLAALELAGAVPLLADHANRLNAVAGSGTPRVEAGTLRLDGTLAPTPAGRMVADLARAGVPLQASVGVTPTNPKRLRAGETIHANGREHKAGAGGLTFIPAGRLREVTITPLGADPTTTVSVLAKKGQTMSAAEVEAAVVEASTSAPPTLPPDPVEAERARVREILAHGGGQLNDLAHEAIQAGWTLERFKAGALDVIRARAGASSISFATPSGPSLPRGTDRRTYLAATALVMAGQEASATRHFGERITAGVQRVTGWPELCAMALRAEGRDVPGDRYEMIRAAFSTTTLPNALGLSVEKVMLDTFLDASRNWQSIARTVPVRDFRDGKAIRLSAASKFEPVAPTGELKFGDLAEDAFTVRAGTFGKIFGITRVDIINDDLGLLSELPTVLGAEGARTVSDAVFDAIVANVDENGDPFFDAAKGNVINAALSVEGLSEAIATLRTRRDRDNRIIGFTPAVLVVPAALEATALGIITSTALGPGQDQGANLPTANPWRGIVSVVVEPRLDDDSPDDWYLFSQPRHGAILASFLQGRMNPVVEQNPAPFHLLGEQWRAYLDFGITLGEYRGGVKSDVAPYDE